MQQASVANDSISDYETRVAQAPRKQITTLPPLSAELDEDLGVALDAASIRRDFVEKLYCMQAKFPGVSTPFDHYQALAYTIRDRLLHRWVKSAHTYLGRTSRTVAYLSAEFLLGPQLGHNILALGAMDNAREAMSALGIELDALLEDEVEPALGNGGLGRLAACFMDSLATLNIPAIGYGIRYEYGIFEQTIRDGAQSEKTDKWLRLGCPWMVARPEITFPVGFGGRTESGTDAEGRYFVRWIPERTVLGTPNDIPVLGYGTNNTNFLRLWQALAPESLDLSAFNVGDYLRAVHDKIVSENITKVLYPNDDSPQGKKLRLEQQYFFVCCSLQDMIRLYLQRMPSLDNFHEKFAVQLNDTHPSLAIPELMRLLVDEYRMDWDRAWAITGKTFSYTNHTLLPEALETWPLDLFASVLPRHLELIYEINSRFLASARKKWPNDQARIARLSLIDERGGRRVRMANLATVGSHTVNGVAAIHSRLLRETVLHDFAELTPEKMSNVTNGVTPRRFLQLSNPRLAALISEAIGDGWTRDLEALSGLEKVADDAAFREKWRAVKQANKARLSKVLASRGLALDPELFLDVQVKRIHEYKRQLLNLLHAVTCYQRIKAGREPRMPRTILFAGKAAPGYFMAKLVIRLIHEVARKVEEDPAVRRWIKIIFVPNFNVKNGEKIYPAADLSEQISTAGMEASGTGNMKLTMNGALTIGTLDGANVEIRDAVGAENFFLFGLTAEQVAAAKAQGHRPLDYFQRDAELRAAIELIAAGADDFAPVVRGLLEHDPFLVLADYRGYIEAQSAVEAEFLAPDRWTRKSILNVARVGRFSSDRSIREYAANIWKVDPVPVV